MRRYRKHGGESLREGGKPRKPSGTPRKPFIRGRVNPDGIPLLLLDEGERRQQVRKAMIQTMGLTREAYGRHLEERVEYLERIVARDTEQIAALSYRIAEMEADNVMMMGTEAEEMDSARAIVERDEEALG